MVSHSMADKGNSPFANHEDCSCLRFERQLKSSGKWAENITIKAPKKQYHTKPQKEKGHLKTVKIV